MRHSNDVEMPQESSRFPKLHRRSGLLLILWINFRFGDFRDCSGWRWWEREAWWFGVEAEFVDR